MKEVRHFIFEPSDRDEAILAGKIGLVLATTTTYATQINALLDNYELLIHYIESLNPELIEKSRTEARKIAEIIDKNVGKYLHEVDYSPSKEIGLFMAISALFYEVSSTILKKIANSCIYELKKMGAIDVDDLRREE